MSANAASVDCSGLVNIVYRACGLLVPRDARPQFVAATPINPSDLELGDLIFLEYIDAKGVARVRHPMLYAGLDSEGNACVIESTGRDAVVEKGTRIITTQKLLGLSTLKDIDNGVTAPLLEDGQEIGKTTVCCGTYLDPAQIQQWRNALLNVK